MRLSRIATLAGTGIFHKFWQGHNGEKVLNTDAQKHQYLTQLCRRKTEEISKHVQWYSYCIMNNHPHEIGRVGWNPTIKNAKEKGVKALGNWMRNSHSVFGRWYNVSMERKGKVSCERPKTTQIASFSQVLNAMFYSDANPVKAGIVSHPSKYKWSSYNFYAYGIRNEFTDSLDMPEAYLALGKTPEQRQRSYRSLMTAYLRKNGLLFDIPDSDETDLQIYDSMFDAIDAMIALANNKSRTRPG